MSLTLQLIPGLAALFTSIAALIWSIRRSPGEGGKPRRKARPKPRDVAGDRPARHAVQPPDAARPGGREDPAATLPRT